MSQALYRKYRSRSLAEIVGQEHITNTLARALAAGRISHAYLFTGPRGTGKTSVARILAFEINKIAYTDTPQLDIIEIDAASNRRIDDIRDLREKVHIAPVNAPYKVYIIDEVHMLTGESFNALLKTLEEPPSHVIFILATTEAHKLPATIISRTQRFSFHPAERTKLTAHLKNIAKKEKLVITDDALALIAEHGDGSYRDSLSLLDQMTHVAEGEITAAKVEQTLGLAPKESMQQLVQAITNNDRATIASALSQFEADGGSISALITQIAKALVAQGSEQPQLYGLVDKLLDVPRAYNPRLKLLTVLMSAAVGEHTTPRAAAPKPETKSAPALAAPAPVLVTPIVAPPKPQPEPKVEPEKPAPIEGTPIGQLGDNEWQAILAALKKTNPPLVTVLKYATPHFDTEKQELKLGFKYQLHRKKVDDPKQKAILARVIMALHGTVPLITCVVGTPKPNDPTVDSVAAIMGGGEQIDP